MMEGLLTERSFLYAQNTKLLEDVSALAIERDNAIMNGMALTVEKDGMQIEIDRLRAESASKDKEIAALTAKVQELEDIV